MWKQSLRPSGGSVPLRPPTSHHGPGNGLPWPFRLGYGWSDLDALLADADEAAQNERPRQLLDANKVSGPIAVEIGLIPSVGQLLVGHPWVEGVLEFRQHPAKVRQT